MLNGINNVYGRNEYVLACNTAVYSNRFLLSCTYGNVLQDLKVLLQRSMLWSHGSTDTEEGRRMYPRTTETVCGIQ